MTIRTLLGTGIAALTLLASAALANPTQPLVEPFGPAELERQRVADNQDYLLPLSAWRRAGGDWQLEQSERLTGTLARFTWRIADGYSAAEAHRHWLTALRAVGARSLYGCRGRACGPSNQWANAVFDNRELYGLDGAQWFDALELTEDGHHYAVAIYSVERGNRRVYSHLDIITLDSDRPLQITADGLLLPLREHGQLVFAQAEAAAREPVVADDALAALVQALRKDLSVSLYVVGHSYAGTSGAMDVDALQARAQEYADRVVASLVERGIPAQRVQAAGVGPLAPGTLGRVDRIELVRAGR
ncbi:MAG: DUF4892 domain-containing protein [Spongiibacteraceae bacterium]|jgi:hypothetical protein|nr:DUF4892 domain-containing protein [Spongiibacteraceae bacterium]